MAMNPRLLRPRATFDPRRIANLLAWYDASDSSSLFSDDAATAGVSADGQVAVWRDKSANAHHLTQSTGANRPLYRTSGIGGRPALDFNGSSSSIATRDGSNNLTFPIDLAASKAFSFVCVSIASSGNTLLPFSFKRTNVGDFQSGLVVYTTTASNEVEHILGNGASSFRTEKYTATVTNAHILSASFSTTGSFLARFNSVTQTTTVSGQALTTWLGSGSGNHNLCVGARGFSANNNLGQFMNGKIAELAMYTRALSLPELQQLERYVSGKYGIA
jgi:hypothetical protein